MNHWQKYTDTKKGGLPNKLLENSLPYIKNKDFALDLGAGALNDTIFLLSQRFKSIVAIDSERNADDIFQQLPQDKVQYITGTFDEYGFQPNHYDLINAQYSLPFASPESINKIFENIKVSLRKDGIFTGQLFGLNDEWRKNPNMNFQSKNEVINLLDGLEIILLDESEKDRKTALGIMKHWHVFNIIARKK